MVRKLVALWSVLRTSTFIIVTDTKTIVHIPDWLDPKQGDNMLWLVAQRSSLQDIVRRLEKALQEHDKQVDKLSIKHQGGNDGQ